MASCFAHHYNATTTDTRTNATALDLVKAATRSTIEVRAACAWGPPSQGLVDAAVGVLKLHGCTVARGTWHGGTVARGKPPNTSSTRPTAAALLAYPRSLVCQQRPTTLQRGYGPFIGVLPNKLQIEAARWSDLTNATNASNPITEFRGSLPAHRAFASRVSPLLNGPRVELSTVPGADNIPVRFTLPYLPPATPYCLSARMKAWLRCR